MSRLDVSSHELAAVRQILAVHVPEYDVYAFGSRVRGNAGKSSDLDLAVMTERPLDTLRKADLREAFSESDLSFKVDLTDWAGISEDFKKIISESRFKIQTGKKADTKKRKQVEIEI